MTKDLVVVNIKPTTFWMLKEVKYKICFKINPDKKRTKKINQLEDINPKIIQSVSNIDKHPNETNKL